MKRPGFLAASMAAASATTAITSSKTSHQDHSLISINHPVDSSQEKMSCCLEKFAPRFDGLRFIETLITAHR